MIKCLVTAGAYTSGYIPITLLTNTNSKYSVNGNTVNIKVAGVNDVKANVTIEATSAANITLSLYVNGMPIQGASATVTAVSGDTYTLQINDVVRTIYTEDNEYANVELVLSGACTLVSGDFIVEHSV